METSTPRFLTAEWLHLAVLNFEIDPAALRPYLPEGTEIDFWQGRAIASLVGFQFRNTRVWNLPIPFHRHFAEVNLRFYARRLTPTGWRRGVVFIKELAPRRAIAWTARVVFGENYTTVPMHHYCELPNNGNGDPRRVGYAWRLRGREYKIDVMAHGPGSPASPGSEAEFLLEQSWGYSGRPGRRTIEYRVEHPRWNIWQCATAEFQGDVSAVYGPPFVEALTATPKSAYLVDGSAVTLFQGRAIS